MILPSGTLAHGGVALTDDVCVMSLGNLSAHFAIYQPEASGSTEFCEDIPDASRSIFVIDFIHDVLADMDVEFRIVRDVNNAGLAANWEDYQAIASSGLEQATLHYSAPARYPAASMTLEQKFPDKGAYIGVIVARHPETGKEYRSVFPFRVGNRTFIDYLPYFLVALVGIELFYWLSNGGMARIRALKISQQPSL